MHLRHGVYVLLALGLFSAPASARSLFLPKPAQDATAQKAESFIGIFAPGLFGPAFGPWGGWGGFGGGYPFGGMWGGGYGMYGGMGGFGGYGMRGFGYPGFRSGMMPLYQTVTNFQGMVVETAPTTVYTPILPCCSPLINNQSYNQAIRRYTYVVPAGQRAPRMRPCPTPSAAPAVAAAPPTVSCDVGPCP